MRFLSTSLAALLLMTAGAAYGADAWPSRSIRFIVPYPPGGPTDLMARSMSGRLTEALGQSVVVDNRAGAGGNVGAEPVGGTPQQFAAFMAAETIKWAKVIKASGAKID